MSPTEKQETTPATVSKNTQNNTSESNASGKSVSGVLSSPGAKFFLIGVITFALLIPAMMVWVLVEERANRAEEVAASISHGWGGRQLINGPYLVVPYKAVAIIDKKTKTVTRNAIISAEHLDIEAEVDVEERKKSIYKTQLYNMKARISGRFAKPNLQKIVSRGGKIDMSNAFLVIAVSDTTGFRSDVIIKTGNGSTRKFLPGLNGMHMNHSVYERNNGVYYSNVPPQRATGVHLPVELLDASSGFDFTIDMVLNGSRELSIMPAAQTTKLKIESNWPHPGFDGRFLPETREITKEGFSATWTIPELARGIDAIVQSSTLPAADTLMRVNFVEPLKFYQITSRTLKYSIAFFSLIFLAIFILELCGQKRVHWIQYILTGFAMVIFYILLLALAEQIGFDGAYLVSSLATTALIAWYIGDSLGSRRGSLVMAAVLGLTYFIMYLILNEEEYALLAGAMIAFLSIAVTMFTTRKVDWTGKPEVSGVVAA